MPNTMNTDTDTHIIMCEKCTKRASCGRRGTSPSRCIQHASPSMIWLAD